MKKSIFMMLVCAFLLGTLTSTAQFNISVPGPKPKEKEKEKVKVKEDNSSDTKKTTTTTTTTTSATPTKTVSFSELETKKMEWTSTFERLEKGWDKISYQDYDAKKAEYNKFYTDFSAAYKKERGQDHSDTYTQKLITKIDGFYTETIPAEKMASIKDKAKRSFDDKDWTVYPSDRITDIETAEKMIATAKTFLTKTDPALEEYEKSLVAQKEKIKAYVAGGGLEKRDAEIEKKLVEERRLHAAAMTDASVNSTVSAKIDKEKYGTPQRVVITSNTWEVEKNEYGIAKLKFVKVDIATKKSDGKCYYLKGSVAQTHEGGGQYGPKYLNIFYTEGEMNCANINK